MKIKKTFALLLMTIFIFNIGGCTTFKKALKPNKIAVDSDITFYIATDLHYLSKDLTDGGEAFKKFVSSGAGKQLDYIDETVSALAYDIKKKKPDILIISGDLTSNGEEKSHKALAKKLVEIEKSGTSVYVIPGNHDILNPWARGFKGDKQYVTDNISAKEFSSVYKDFGYGEAISKDKSTLSYLAAPSEKVWLLMLDTNQYKNNLRNNAPQTDGQITKDTMDWIKKCSALAKEKGARIITVMHHSLLNHSEVIQEGYTINNNQEVINGFEENGLDLILSGHIHIQDISSYKKGNSTIYDIATGSLAVNPHQYGILKYFFKNNEFDYSTSKVDVEGWSRVNGAADKNLNTFTNYSEEFFGSIAFDIAYKQLAMEENYAEDEIKQMSEVMKILNIRYFAGTENLNSKDIMSSEGFKLWLNSKEGFQKRYIMSILEDKDTEDNSLHIKLEN